MNLGDSVAALVNFCGLNEDSVVEVISNIQFGNIKHVNFVG